MFKWLLRKQQEKKYAPARKDSISKDQNIRTLAEPDVLSRIQDYLATIDPGARAKLLPIRSRLTELVITPSDQAIEQLETTNVSRQKIWGDQAVRVPILQGSADSVFCALLECLVDDYAENWVKSLLIEEVAAPRTDDETKQLEHARDQMRPNLDTATKDYYEKKMMKHMRKKGKDKAFAAVREINLKLFFSQNFGPHRIVRVSEDKYYFMRQGISGIHMSTTQRECDPRISPPSCAKMKEFISAHIVILNIN